METGYYEPNTTVHVTVWTEGDPVPDGFVNKFSTTDAGKIDNWVRVDRYDDPIRSEDGELVAALPEGGALAEWATGFRTIYPEEMEKFALSMKPTDAPAVPVVPVPAPVTETPTEAGA